MPEMIKVVVTGAAGQIGYSIILSIAKGDVFGKDQPISLVLLDIPPMMGVLHGVVMELNDCAIPLLKEIVPTDDYAVAFKDIDVAILIGAMPRREGMERKDLLAANVKIFKGQGQAIEQYSKKTVKVVVVGNPANTNALICKKYAPSIPGKNFSCLTRLDQNRAMAQIAGRLGISNSDVYNCTIWGNHSSTQYPDVRHAKAIVGGETLGVHEAVKDDNWLRNEFIKTVQTRGGAVIKARKLSSAMSAAKATCDHMHDWWFGTEKGRWVSMGVISDGSYGIDEGLMYSFPIQCTGNGEYEIVKDLAIDDFSRGKMDATADELKDELAMAMAECKDN